jgi:hypothetical protein
MSERTYTARLHLAGDRILEAQVETVDNGPLPFVRFVTAHSPAGIIGNALPRTERKNWPAAYDYVPESSDLP